MINYPLLKKGATIGVKLHKTASKYKQNHHPTGVDLFALRHKRFPFCIIAG